MLSSAPTSQVFIFGDQTSAFESDLRSLLHVKDNESLRSFFEKANYALRFEIARLPVSQRESSRASHVSLIFCNTTVNPVGTRLLGLLC
jgi:hypothetical protein